MRRDWPVKKAFVDLPIRMKGNSKPISGNSLSLLGTWDKDDAGRFKRLANSVEEFTYCLLDPLKTDSGWCKQFGDYSLDEMLNDAIEFKQRKVGINSLIKIS